ncbi:MAG: single-stranded DNA-binding protein [Rhodospirillaceae bacterium]|jgi:single-strand DNA-binding protein|nr:single-stranded DNA-binding protein [Rhodospirillaceae bacterium]
MAGSINKVILVGNLGRDPEIRTTQNGAKVVNMRLATSEQWKDRDGNRQERTEWHSIVIFNEHLAGIAERYLHKGSKIYVEGQLQTRKWTDQQGVEKYTTEVMLGRFRGDIQMLDSRGDSGGGGGGGQYGDDRNQGGSMDSGSQDQGGSSGGASDLDDEIPF